MVFGRWDGYKWRDSNIMNNDHEPFFHVRISYCKILKKNTTTCQVNMGSDKSKAAGCYQIVGSLARKSAFQIIDSTGSLVAEVILHINLYT